MVSGFPVHQGVSVKPFLVAAFLLGSTSKKCFKSANVPEKWGFNYDLICRRVVEQAFGRLKERWKIMDSQCRIMIQCLCVKLPWFAVPSTTGVKGINVLLGKFGCLKKLHMWPQLHPICKQMWLLTQQQVLKITLLPASIIIIQHHSNSTHLD